MIGRAVMATVLLFATLSGVAIQRSAAPRPTMRLMLFKGPGPNGGPCPPCDRFSSDFRTCPPFANAIRQRFELVPAWDIRKDPNRYDDASFFRRYKVEKWPTFIVVDRDGKELGRVTGYQGTNDLWAALSRVHPLPTRPKSDTPRQRPDPPAAIRKPSIDPEVLGQLQKANEQLTEQNDLMADKIALVEGDLQRARERSAALQRKQVADTEAARAEIQRERAEALADIAMHRKRMQTESRKLEDIRRRPRSDPVNNFDEQTRPSAESAPGDGSTAECKDGVCEIPTLKEPLGNAKRPAPEADSISDEMPAEPSSGFWRDSVGWIVKTAAKSAVLSQPEFAIPLSIAGTLLAYAANRYRKQKGKKGGSPAAAESEPIVATLPQPTAAEPAKPFELLTLPLQAMDYSKTWAEHALFEGRSPELAAKEFAHFVNAFEAVKRGELELPGIADGDRFCLEIRNWVLRQFQQYQRSSPDHNNPNHRALYAFLHKQAMLNIRNGKFNEAAPNPKAADVLEDWVNQKLVGELVFSPE